MVALALPSETNSLHWAGRPPQLGHGVSGGGKLRSLALLPLDAARDRVLDYFNNTWTLTEVLFSGLAHEEAFYRRPSHGLRHPLIFYYAHPAVLYVNKLRVAGLLDGPVNADYECLFAVGVDEMRWDDLREGGVDIWPQIQDVCAYREQVYTRVRELILRHPDLDSAHLPVSQASAMWALFMGFEHERIHLETSSVLIREPPIDLVRTPEAWPALSLEHPSTRHPSPRMLEQPKTQVSLGKPQAWPSYGWDNEYGSETAPCPAFFAAQFLVSNGEFKRFVQAGGYSRGEFWSPEGWAWRCFEHTMRPTFWVPEGPAGLHQYKLRTIFQVIEMQWSWPACVNAYEAEAYCAWLTKEEGSKSPYRLLSEIEHHAIRDTASEDPSLGVERDAVMAGTWRTKGYNLNFSAGSEGPVDAGMPNDKGFHDSFGNVWQWSSSRFRPLAGSRPHPFYEDFSVPCYDDKHFMIFGGSFISTGDQASIWARFHFRPHFFQHAGFRVARSTEPSRSSSGGSGPALYESQDLVNRYMLMHWGTHEEILKDVPEVSRPDVVHLPRKCAELVFEYASGFGRALDLGCAVGRAGFEMARRFSCVQGIDYSHEFVERANQLKHARESRYWRKATGADGSHLLARVDAEIDSSRLHFEQGDACALSPTIEGFDAVLLSNVLCRLPDPAACLRRMQGNHALVRPGGILVMMTPLSWLEDYTPKSKWLNGLADIEKILSEFDLVHQEELPFMLREHQRKFEYIITQASVWRRRST
jgi:5-histidylcysteine sulfoxide synthase/putative 4-mercaptohistidine N1-methyltranferase